MLSLIDERQFEEDAIILKVIEAYCLSVNARFTVHSGESTCRLWITFSVSKMYCSEFLYSNVYISHIMFTF